MRYFNTLGPVNQEEHYVVPRGELITNLVTQIERGKYFTIFAPRQMGKTTLLRDLRDTFSTQVEYLPITLSFEDYEGLPAEEFLPLFAGEFAKAVIQALPDSHPALSEVRHHLANANPTSFPALRVFWEALHDLLPTSRLVLIIDEFDAIPQAAISPLLRVWRKIYLGSAPPRILASVILVGIRNIATLNFGRSSPFNIASQLRLSEFTLSQVRDLLGQYTAESGQSFAEGVIEEIHQQTGGQPFLVNRLAALLTEEIVTDKSKPIMLTDLARALQELIRETNYNFQSIVRHARVHEEEVLNILFGAEYEFNLNNPLIHHLFMHGIIARTAAGFCQIANPIYSKVLLAAFRPLRWQLQADILANGYDFAPHFVGGQLQMKLLLSRFRQFVERRGREAFKVTPTPLEATGQYLLMAYLSSVVRQVGGDLFTEVESGEGRMDLIVVHGGRRYVVETKIWRGQAKFKEGLDQLSDYLETEGQKEGYLVVFHARPKAYGKLSYDQLEFTLKHKRHTIHVYLVRLGALFQKTSQAAQAKGKGQT